MTTSGQSDATWTCDLHRVTTAGDCPRCDDELIALTEADTPIPEKCFWCKRGTCRSCLGDGTECPCCALSSSEEHLPWSYTEFGVLCACGSAMSADGTCASLTTYSELVDRDGNRWYAVDGLWYRRDHSDCRGSFDALVRDFGPVSEATS